MPRGGARAGAGRHKAKGAEPPPKAPRRKRATASKAHAPAPADGAELVQILAAAGYAHSAIAAVIGCEVKVLRRDFAPQLADAQHIINARVTTAIFRAAEAGNMTAARLWCEGGGASAATGKKGERAAAATRAATGKYAPPPPPGLKAKRTHDSQDAEKGTSWEDLMDRDKVN